MELTGTVITKLNSRASTRMTAPPTMTPGSSRTLICPAAAPYMPNARLAIVNKAAKDIAPTFDAAHAACNVARTIAGIATQIDRTLDITALPLWALLQRRRVTVEIGSAAP